MSGVSTRCRVDPKLQFNARFVARIPVVARGTPCEEKIQPDYSFDGTHMGRDGTCRQDRVMGGQLL